MARRHLFGLALAFVLGVHPALALDAVGDGAGRTSPPQLAQKPPAAPAAPKIDPAMREAGARMAGDFRLTSADGTRACAFTLKPDASGSALTVDFDKEACAVIGFSGQVSAWLPDPSGSIRLLNAQGRTVAEFTEGAGGSYEALKEGDGVYFLTNPSVADATEVNVEEVVGDWDLSRTAGAPVCRWTLQNVPAGKGEGRIVSVAAGCDSSMLRFAPVAWDIEGGNILVRGVASGAMIRFARQEDGSWARTPERGRPLLMTRP